MNLSGKFAIVTGAAGGIGGATVRRLVAGGAAVAGLDIDVEGGERLAEELTGQGHTVGFIECDVSKGEDVARAVDSAASVHGRVDILCNIAGAINGVFFDVVNTPEEGWDLVQSVNLRSMYLMCRAVVPVMLQGGGGAIVNLGSVSSLTGSKDRAAYSAAKGGVLNLTRSMSIDYAEKGVRVNCVAPGLTDTPRISRMFQHLGDGEARLSEYLTGVPMGRMATADEVAAGIVFLVSDEASFITGSLLPVDGGFLAR